VKCLAELDLLHGTDTDEAQAVLVSEFERFLQVGGAVTWDFWSGLSEVERLCFEKAAENLRGGIQQALEEAVAK